jgi:sugar phosphate isomerase/epimerase
MIKIGCAAYSYREYLKDGRMSYEDFIEGSYRLGLDGVEITLYWIPSKEPSYFRELKRLASSRGLPIPCAATATNFCNPDISEREHVTKTAKEGLDIAHELGASFLRVFGGNVPEGYTTTEATQWTIESIKSCVGYAEEKGVVIVMENHHGITERADNVVKIVEGVDSPWFRVMLDLGNYYESTYEEIAKTVPYAVHAHAKVRVPRQMKLDYRRIREILEAGGYNGFLSIEYEEKEDPKIGVPRFARLLFEVFR